jgi:hypothetical protein
VSRVSGYLAGKAMPANRAFTSYHPIMRKETMKNATNLIDFSKWAETYDNKSEQLLELDLVDIIKQIDEEADYWEGSMNDSKNYAIGLRIAKEIIFKSMLLYCKNGHNISDFDEWNDPESKVDYFYHGKCYCCELESESE